MQSSTHFFYIPCKDKAATAVSQKTLQLMHMANSINQTKKYYKTPAKSGHEIPKKYINKNKLIKFH